MCHDRTWQVNGFENTFPLTKQEKEYQIQTSFKIYSNNKHKQNAFLSNVEELQILSATANLTNSGFKVDHKHKTGQRNV